MLANRLPKWFINKSFRMIIAYESGERVMHRIAPNLQSFARKERYSVTLKGRSKLTTWSNAGRCLDDRTGAEGHTRSAKSQFLRPRRVGLMRRRTHKRSATPPNCNKRLILLPRPTDAVSCRRKIFAVGKAFSSRGKSFPHDVTLDPLGDRQ
jgi:hypothetical protein